MNVGHRERAWPGSAARVVAILAVLAVLGACGGESDPVEVPRATTATAERVIEDGAATARSTVRVEFEEGEEIELALDGGELRDAFTLRTPGLNTTFTPQDLPVTSVSVSRSEPNVVLLEVDGLVPERTELRIRRAALAEGGEGSYPVSVESQLTALDVVLSTNPVAPVDAALFSVAQVPEVTPGATDEAAMRSALEAHLQVRGTTGAVLDRALDYYDNVDRAVVASPKLRAALAGLTGTYAEPAIPHLLTNENCTSLPAERIAFEPPPDFPDLLARVTYGDDGARIISLNPVLEGEPFQLLMPILLHEAIHCDQVDGQDEEIAATALDAFFYILLIAAEPELARAGTTLSRNFNVDALALMNSGRLLPESVGVLPSGGVGNVFPGIENGPSSFAAHIAAAYDTLPPGPSEPEALAIAYVALLGADLELAPGNPFDLAYLDALLGLTMHPPVLWTAMEVLGVEPVAP